MCTKLKPVPAFKDEAEERRFWEMHDSADYLDWSKAERVRLPSLKPSQPTMSLRVPHRPLADRPWMKPVWLSPSWPGVLSRPSVAAMCHDGWPGQVYGPGT
jgi:hypothetical protein